MYPEDPSEDLQLQFISAVPQCWADRGHYSYLDSPRPEDALLFFLPEESGCSFTLYLDSGAVFHPKQGDIFYTPRGSRFALQVDNPAHPHLNQPHGPKIITNLCVKFLTQEMDGQPAGWASSPSSFHPPGWPGNANCFCGSSPACTGTFTVRPCFCRPSSMS